MTVVRTREQLLAVGERLVQEHADSVAPGAVLRCVARCRDELLLVGVRDGLPEAVEAMARRRLRERSGQDGSARVADLREVSSSA